MRSATPRADPLGFRRLLSLMIAGGASLTACESSGTAPESESVPSGIRFSSAELTLFVPTTALLGATVVDQRGVAVPGRSLAFETRDPTVATVNAAGVVTPVSAGESWIVARSAELADSVRVTVRYRVLMEEARVRIRGSIDTERSWDPYSVARTRLGPIGGSRLVLEMWNQAPVDTGLVVVLPSMPAPGSYPLDGSSPSQFSKARSVFDLERPLGLAFIETAGDPYLYMAQPGSRLEIESVDDAGRYGLTGTLRGRIVLRARGHRLDPLTRWEEEQTWLPTADTLTIHGDFGVNYRNRAVGQASFRVEGGASPIFADDLPASWYEWEDLVAGYGTLQVEEGPPYIALYSPAPSLGVAQIDSVGWGQWPESGKRYVEVSAGEYGYALSKSGQLTVTGIREPEGQAWGEMIGHLSATLGYWPSYWMGADSDPVGSITLALAFHVPMIPPEPRPTAGAAMRGGKNTPFLDWLRPTSSDVDVRAPIQRSVTVQSMKDRPISRRSP